MGLWILDWQMIGIEKGSQAQWMSLELFKDPPNISIVKQDLQAEQVQPPKLVKAQDMQTQISCSNKYQTYRVRTKKDKQQIVECHTSVRPIDHLPSQRGKRLISQLDKDLWRDLLTLKKECLMKILSPNKKEVLQLSLIKIVEALSKDQINIWGQALKEWTNSKIPEYKNLNMLYKMKQSSETKMSS